jgi:hypothetical protein
MLKTRMKGLNILSILVPLTRRNCGAINTLLLWKGLSRLCHLPLGTQILRHVLLRWRLIRSAYRDSLLSYFIRLFTYKRLMHLIATFFCIILIVIVVYNIARYRGHGMIMIPAFIAEPPFYICCSFFLYHTKTRLKKLNIGWCDVSTRYSIYKVFSNVLL